jgi:hypothetical protein
MHFDARNFADREIRGIFGQDVLGTNNTRRYGKCLGKLFSA